ncbi:MAG: hypothetical protein PUF50_08395 [Erysipelotrichaceae bacterium]|nr:hypothetical protein [Erysipelotrichaceae bacterium]
MKKAWKGFMNLIFEEEIIEEVIEEEEPKNETVEASFQDIRLNPVEKVETPEVPQVEEAPKKSDLLTIHPVREKPKAPAKKLDLQSPVSNNKINYEFTRVISPIYGLKDDAEAQKPAVKLTTPKKVSGLKSPIGTVLSPMYGTFEENPLVNEVEVEPEVKNMSLDDFIVEEPQETVELDNKNLNGAVNLSLFDDEEQ